MKTLSSVIRHVVKVLKSCKTETQLDNTMNWAVAVVANEAKTSGKEAKHERGASRKRLIPPRVTVCSKCSGTGSDMGVMCAQCEGSGRVIVSSDVVTFITAYKPSSST